MKASKQKVKRVRPLLGTYVEIELYGNVPQEKLNAWITAGFEAVEEINRLMSVFRPDSDISRLNQAAPKVWVTVNSHTLTVLKAANKFYRVSDGVFDIRFLSSSPAAVGGGSLSPDGPPTETLGGDGLSRARKTGPWILDLGGIAKGYAVDHAVGAIQKVSRGYRLGGVVNAGGDLRRWGPDRPPIAVATSAVRTPGNSERLSPATHVKMPAGIFLHEPRTASVISRRCLWSDALTKVVLLGSKQMAKRCLALYHAQSVTQ